MTEVRKKQYAVRSLLIVGVAFVVIVWAIFQIWLYVHGMDEGSVLSMLSGLFIIITVLGIYLLPVFIAYQRNHRNLLGVGLLDILLGWTIVGWVVAMILATRKSGDTHT